MGLVGDTSEAIDKLLEKKHFSPDMDRDEKEKIAAFIIKRGFSSVDVFRCMKTYVTDTII